MNALSEYLPFFGYGDNFTSIPLWALLAASVGLDLALSELLLFRCAKPPTVARIAVAVVGMAVLLVVKALVFSQLHLSMFGVMLLAWYTLALVVPVVGLRMLLLARGLVEFRDTRIVGYCALLTIPLSLYARFIEPTRLRVDRATIEIAALARADRPLRIGVLSDLQCESIGDHERAAVQLLMREQPDAILIPGDLLQGSSRLFERWLPELRELLQELQAPGGVYLIVGDVDGLDRCRRASEGTHIRLLENEVAEFECASQRVRVFGMASPHKLNRFTTSGHARAFEEDSINALRAFAAEDEPTCLRIMLSHHPRVVQLLAFNHNVDLAVAGHTHGGQVALPLLGPPITASPLPRSIAAGGLHSINGVQLYVSRGVGMERSQAPRIRFLVPPEVGVLEVTGASALGSATDPTR